MPPKQIQLIEGRNDFENGVIGVLRLGLASIGPEEILIKEHEPLFFKSAPTLYDFKDSLKYNFEMFFWAQSSFNTLVIDKIKEFKKHSNVDYGIALCKKVVKEVADRILKREENICDNLNKYLLPDDVDFALKYIDKLLKENFDTYTITLLTDLLSLDGIDNIELANLKVSKLQEVDKEKYPALKGKGLLGFLNGNFEINKHWDNLIEIQTTQQGLHLDDEASKVFEKAISEFKTFFSYLLLCEHKLQNVRGNKFKINTEDLSYEGRSSRKSKGIQKYYIKKSNDSKILLLNTKYLDPYISNKKITLNKEGLKKIEINCALEKYEKVIKEKDGNSVAQKIIRAMDWFLQANLEDDKTDSVIKYFIALESLFSTGNSGLNNKTICDNVAMFCDNEIKGRLEYTKKFSKLLKWRNKIVHHGKNVEDNPDYWKDLRLLKVGVTWSILGIILLYDKICTLGKDGNSVNRFFNNRKLAARII